MIQPMIKALRNNNVLAIKKYEDISINLDEITVNYRSNMELNGKIQEAFKERKKSIELIRKSTIENLMLDITNMGLFTDITNKDLKKLCEKVVEEASVDEEYSKLKLQTLKLAMNFEEKTKQKEENRNTKVKPSGLVGIYEKARNEKIHNYELLDKNGYIKNPIKEFLEA